MHWFQGKFTGKPHDLHGKIYGFRLRFSQQNQSIERKDYYDNGCNLGRIGVQTNNKGNNQRHVSKYYGHVNGSQPILRTPKATHTHAFIVVMYRSSSRVFPVTFDFGWKLPSPSSEIRVFDGGICTLPPIPFIFEENNTHFGWLPSSKQTTNIRSGKPWKTHT